MELNKKLAEWAGFKLHTRKSMVIPDFESYEWEWPTGEREKKLPWFTESLDACFKWLVPKIEGLQQIILQPDEDGRWYLGMTVNDKLYENLGFNPALALCLAIEKLIEAKDGR